MFECQKYKWHAHFETLLWNLNGFMQTCSVKYWFRFFFRFRQSDRIKRHWTCRVPERSYCWKYHSEVVNLLACKFFLLIIIHSVDNRILNSAPRRQHLTWRHSIIGLPPTRSFESNRLRFNSKTKAHIIYYYNLYGKKNGAGADEWWRKMVMCQSACLTVSTQS